MTKVLLRGDKEPNYVLLSRNRKIKSSRELAVRWSKCCSVS